MKDRRTVRWVTALAGACVVQFADAQTIYSVGQTATGGVPSVLLHWMSNPLDQYEVYATTNLASGSWTQAIAQAVTASNLTAGTSLPHADAASFFLVQKKDLDAPAIRPVYPASSSVAVPRSSFIQVQLGDATGVATGSVVLTLNGTNYNLSSPALSFVSNSLLFLTASNGLGTYGQTATVSVAAADVLGNARTNTWRFMLERPPVVNSNVFVFGSGVTTNGLSMSPRSLPADRIQSASTLQLIGTYTDRLVFAYTGTPGLGVGQLLASSDPANIYYRKITSLSNDVPNGQITAFTTEARLEQFFQSASLNNAIFTSAGTNAQAIRPLDGAAAWDALTFHRSGSILSYSNSNPTIGVHGSFGSWDVAGAASVAADISSNGLKSCQLGMIARLTVDLTPQVVMSVAGSASSETPLMAPMEEFYYTFVGTVPVWVKVVVEVNAGVSLSGGDTGSITGGVHMVRELAYSISMKDNNWTYENNTGAWVYTPVPVTWSFHAAANAKVYLKPKVSIYLYSLVGVSESAKPYFSFEGTYDPSPVKYTFSAAVGMDLDLGLESVYWSTNWGAKPSWNIASLHEVFWTTNYPPAVPVVTLAPTNVNCSKGDTASFKADAIGNPPPKYQWSQNGTPIPGATARALTFTAAEACTGTYQVAISNTNGTTNVTAALVLVQTNMVLIPAGSFTMGDCMVPHEGGSEEEPTHSVFVSDFYMERTDVTKAQWDAVYAWAITNGYSFDHAGEGKAANHPVVHVSWYDCVKWCNARSEMEGLAPCYFTASDATTVYRSGDLDLGNDCVNWTARGYRLPTEAEQEKAARGGVSGQRFPAGNSISWGVANYHSAAGLSYDLSGATDDFDPDYATDGYPYTSPAGSFAANGYGLYDMAGNVWQWCWDWWSHDYYASSPDTDPPGAASGSLRVLRGSSWFNNSYDARCANRSKFAPLSEDLDLGFRCVRKN